MLRSRYRPAAQPCGQPFTILEGTMKTSPLAGTLGRTSIALMLLVVAAAAQQAPPLAIAKQGYLFVGGKYFDAPDGRFMSGQMYVEFQIPNTLTHRFPIVMFSGGGQSGLNYSGTPDGREGWMQYFVRQGYAVYVLDQPSRGRSPHQPEVGPQSRSSVERIQQRFTAPERSNLWPQARLHTQWPGSGVAGDPVFDQFFAQNYPSLSSFPRQQELNRDAGAALLDRIGPAILLTHSQSATFGWLVADARPALVKAIVAMEPSGPPVYDNVEKGAPDWFSDGPLTKPYGLTAPPLAYDPPLRTPADLKFARQDKSDDPTLVRCWAQAEPARSLVNLRAIPMLIVQAEASYHATYDHCTAAYLRQAHVASVRFVRLAEIGIKGNGHMLMLEKNNQEIAAVASRWLRETIDEPGH
jgi:pimeloyl-ACP methyl ester carboxylesterase